MMLSSLPSLTGMALALMLHAVRFSLLLIYCTEFPSVVQQVDHGMQNINIAHPQPNGMTFQDYPPSYYADALVAAEMQQNYHPGFIRPPPSRVYGMREGPSVPSEPLDEQSPDEEAAHTEAFLHGKSFSMA
jgi:hypothetical protein